MRKTIQKEPWRKGNYNSQTNQIACNVSIQFKQNTFDVQTHTEDEKIKILLCFVKKENKQLKAKTQYRFHSHKQLARKILRAEK